MKIGELAGAAQCTVETVRYYEKAGLLPEPVRTASNYRSYNESHVERLRFIRNCRALDMSHREIQGMLELLDSPPGDCSAVNRLIDAHIGHVDVRISELMALKEQLQTIRRHCQGAGELEDCGILQELADMESEPPRDRQTHL